ncbi:MAG: DoxX family protein, partial [Bacteroidia bacterium]|nr:DoxX family protein [Bacteroidia bacterium]
MNIIVTISRIFVGVLFIISGLIKANDPLGFSYKLAEYFTVFGTTWAIPFALFLSMFICVFEVVAGVLTLTGTKARFTAWSLMGMIVFFTFLTFYSAYFNKVTD